MSAVRTKPGCYLFDDEKKILTAAGFTTRWKANLAVEVFDIDRISWSQIQNIPISGHAAFFTIGSHFAVAARFTELRIHLFHPENGTWSALPHKSIAKEEAGLPSEIFAIHSNEMPNKCSVG